MTSLRYFAYGSNMSTLRLTARTPSANVVAIAHLPSHQLKFHKHGRDGSAKCDIAFTDDELDRVYGVVFELHAADKPLLDQFEGLGQGYAEKQVSVIQQNGEVTQAITYYALQIAPALQPYHWYKEHVLRGAKEHRLPPAYIKAIEAVISIPDPEPQRHAQELSIYP